MKRLQLIFGLLLLIGFAWLNYGLFWSGQPPQPVAASASAPATSPATTVAANIVTVFADPALILELLKSVLATCAFIIALYALYSKDTRLRASGEHIFSSLLIYLITAASLLVALIGAKCSSSYIAAQVLATATFASLAGFIIGFIVLFMFVLLPTYNQIYNMKTNKAFRNLRLFRSLKEGRKKPYETNTPPERSLTKSDFPLMLSLLTEDELAQVKRGAMILITGCANEESQKAISAFVRNRLATKDTANYVCCHRHPWEIWRTLGKTFNHEYAKDFVFIDMYTRNFAFTDDIQASKLSELEDQAGLTIVKERTFAGLHTATSKAFNLIKETDASQDRTKIRRPMVMVYDHTSALCEFESDEQFAIFWRHVATSERCYGMLTLVVEDDCSGERRIAVLKQCADFVFRIDRVAADGKVPPFSFVWKREK